MSYKFFQNKECEYFPCHDVEEDNFNCMFCYCPMYFLKCPGKFTLLPDNRKDCSKCTLPHDELGWEKVQVILKDPKIK